MNLSPLILVGIPLAVAPVAFLVQRRLGLAASLSAAAALLYSLVCLVMPLAPVVEVLGRAVALSSLDRIALAFLGLQGAVLTVVEWTTERRATFAPALLLMLGTIAAAVMTSHVGVAGIFVSLAAVMAVFVMAGSDQRIAPSAPGYLVLMVMACLFLVAAAWFGDQVPLQADVSRGPQPAVVLLVISVGILLAVPPFHAWWVETVRQCPAALTVFLGTTLPTVGLLLFMDFLQANSWALAGGSLERSLIVGGLVAGVVGGGLAACSEGREGWLAYSTVAGIGCALAGVGTLTLAGIAGAIILLVNHGLSLTLIIASRLVGRDPWRSAELADARDTGTGGMSDVPAEGGSLPATLGVGRGEGSSIAALLTRLGWVVGGLSLSGVPLTAGFVGRWLAYRELFERNAAASLILILSGLCVLLGYLRTWDDTPAQPNVARTRRGAVILMLLTGGLVAAVFALGIVPVATVTVILQALGPLTSQTR